MRSGTSLGRVRGLGSAKEGTHHWLYQRFTAASNFILMLWLLLAIARQPAYDYASMRMWVQSAWVAVPMLLLVVSVFYHFRLGLQVLIEDYTHAESRVAAMLALNGFVLVTGGIAVFSIVKIALGAAA